MTNQQIQLLISTLCAKNNISSLEKDLLDTWNELCKNPFDEQSAKKQIISNNIQHPDVQLAVDAKPTTICKRADDVTQLDLQYLLQSQLEFLAAKELKEQIKRANNGFV